MRHREQLAKMLEEKAMELRKQTDEVEDGANRLLGRPCGRQTRLSAYFGGADRSPKPDLREFRGLRGACGFADKRSKDSAEKAEWKEARLQKRRGEGRSPCLALHLLGDRAAPGKDPPVCPGRPCDEASQARPDES